jgi:ribosomal protein L32
MGALPKRRISTGRKGRRRTQDNLEKKIVKHHLVSSHKKGIFESLKKALGM